jgi:hypothetical protein
MKLATSASHLRCTWLARTCRRTCQMPHCTASCTENFLALHTHKSSAHGALLQQVFDTPGGHVTRDYREGLGQLADLSFRLLDTSGLEPDAHPASLQVRYSLC